jgi:hypothetical protein
VAKTGPTKVKNVLPGDVFAQGTVADNTAVCKVTLTSGRVLYLEHDDTLDITDHDAQVWKTWREAADTEEVTHGKEAQHEAQPDPVSVRAEGEAERSEPAVRSDAVGRAQGLGEAMKGLIPGRS